MLLAPMATDVMACWQVLAHRVEALQQGRSPIAIGQVLQSTGLAVQRSHQRSGAMVLRVGVSAGNYVPGLRPCGHYRSSNDPNTSRRSPERGWLQAFCFTVALASAAWGWRAVHRPLKLPSALGRVERWQSPVNRARLEIV